jgi:CubicO group peptidase (beta-lactamase class C family)
MKLRTLGPAAAMATVVLSFPALASAADRACAAPDFARKAEALIAPYEQVQAFSGAVLVARDGRVILQRGVGLADREWNIPNTPDTRFRLGSLTKQFTAASILQLAEQGKLSIDDPISKYYPDAPAAWSKVTIRHLLSHRSGIPTYTAIPGFFEKDARWHHTPEEIIKLTRDKPLEFEPGSKFAYDNTGYIVLGWLIEKVSGQTYADYLKAHIFGPLGMSGTGYDVSEEILPRRASGYDFGPQGWRNAPYLDMSLPYAAGSLYSTVDDLLAWEQALFGGKVVSPASLKLMTTDSGDHYGFGLGIDQLQGHDQIAHDGGINGFSTSLQRYPTDGVTSVALSNTFGASSHKIAADLAMLCLGEAVFPREVKLEPAVLDQYAGVYKLKNGPTFTIVREGDHLLSTAPGLIPARLYAKGERDFFAKTAEGEFTFELDPAGKVLDLHMHGPGSPDLKIQRSPAP